jgi:maleate isomerase
LPVTAITNDQHDRLQFGLAPMLEASRLLADARVDAILWSGTSGTWEGLDTDRRLATAIRETTGIPATSASLALLEAFTELNVRRYGLIVPYIERITNAIVANFGAMGYSCSGRTFESLTTNWEFANVRASVLAERARAVARQGVDAIVIDCTNLRGADVVEELESELQVPVLDSVVVGLWGALRLLGIATPSVGFGRLATVQPSTNVAADA